MPTSPRTLFLLLFGAFMLFLAACSSSDDTATDTATTSSTLATDSTGADADLVADPALAEQWAVALTGASVGGDDVACMLELADESITLTTLFSVSPQPTADQFAALAGAVHQCVDHRLLSATLLQLSGAETETQRTEFTTCVVARIDEPVDGDLAYSGLAALNRGVDVPTGARDATIAAGQACQTTEGLVNLFALSTEQASRFNLVADRECFGANIDQAFLDSYWPSLVSADVESLDLGAVIDLCVEEYDSGLLKELPAEFEPWSGDGLLATVDPAVRVAVYSEPPPMTIDPSGTYEAVLTVEAGEIRIALDAVNAPETVNNFVALARDGFYDAIVFHRVLEGFMAQSGDPSATGAGGPGYSFADEPTGLTPIDRRGLLAMANSGPDTNGSQFFITFDAAEHLNGLHTIFGEVVEGDEILDTIELRDPENPQSRGEQLISVEIIEG
jgi:cyclophilin family peptidyl-prolyl cis-trans isomerase